MLCDWVNVQYALNMVAFATLAQAAACWLIRVILCSVAWEQHWCVESGKPAVQVNTNQHLGDTQRHLYVHSRQNPEWHKPKTLWGLCI